MPQHQKHTKALLPSVAIVGDGICEQRYFTELKQQESIPYLRIFPELPDQSGKGGGFMRVFKKAEALKSIGHDHVFCLIDMDVVHNQHKYDAYQKEKAKLLRKGVTIIEINPCFEVWFLLHFERTTALMSNADEVIQKLKGHKEMSDYSKEQRYYLRKRIYETLRGRMQTEAVPNANWLEEQQREGQSHRFPRCEIHKLIQYLLTQHS